MENLYVLGTSGFAREVRDIAVDLGFHVTFVAESTPSEGMRIDTSDVIAEDDFATMGAVRAAIGIGGNAVRRSIFEKYRGTAHFPNLIHPSASFGLGQRDIIAASSGVIICAGVRFTNNIQVGNACIFNLNCTIGHDVVVADYCNVAPGANLSGYVELEPCVWVGTNAAINQGSPAKRLIVGRDVMIGSGSVVVKDCEPGGVYVGIPAKQR
jgi:sugar O-acyltransferase (sialic acid O-acetyltransferase NeuD family)